MKKDRNKYILLLILCVIAWENAASQNRTYLRDSLLRRYAATSVYSQKLRLLRNIIDLSDERTIFTEYSRMYALSRRHADTATQLEAIRGLGNSGVVDTLNKYLSVLGKMPVSHATKEVTVFLRVQRAYIEIGLKNEKERAERLNSLIMEYKRHGMGDIYEQIDRLFTLCIGLSYNMDSYQFKEYLKELGGLVKRLPADGRLVLPKAYYVYAAAFYMKEGTQAEAVSAQERVIEMLRQMEQECKAAGRIYRRFDETYFQTYASMLAYNKVLSPAKIKSYYNKILEITARNEALAEDLNSPTSIVKIRYYMGIKDYKRVSPYLKRYFASGKQIVFQTECLEYAIETGRALHDDKMVMRASMKYIEVLKAKDKEELAQKSKELQVVYDVNTLQQRVSEVSIEKQKDQYEASRKLARTYLVSLIVTVILLTFAIYLLMRYRKIAGVLEISATRLKEEHVKLTDTMDKLVAARDAAESANRMKTMFLQNMNHEIRTPLNAIVGFSDVLNDTTNEWSEEERAEFMKLIHENSDLLTTLINDILDVSRLESGAYEVNRKLVEPADICRAAMDAVRDRVPDGVEMKFEAIGPVGRINTDPMRVEQILINFLTNACKYTEKGHITLSVVTKGDMVEFAVSDTGCGILTEDAERIFNRFEKLDSFRQGTGLGLSICRSISELLGGAVKVDTDYTKGARFVFVVPIEGMNDDD